MALHQPKIIAIDTSMWNRFASNTGRNGLCDQFLSLVRNGSIIPFFSFHHLQELFQTESQTQWTQRETLLRQIPHLAFIRSAREPKLVGGIFDVRDQEILQLLRHGTCDDPLLIRDKVISGFCSGHDFSRLHEDSFEFYKSFGPKLVRESAEFASLTHFQKVPPDTNLRTKYQAISKEKLQVLFKTSEAELGCTIAKHGDHRARVRSRELAKGFTSELWSDTADALENGRDIISELIMKAGIDPEGFNGKTIGDAADFTVFHGWLKIHARRMQMDYTELRAKIRPNQFLSWRIWKNLDAVVRRQIPNASGGDTNDKFFAGFLPYLDGVQLDKRMRECVKQAIAYDDDLRFLYSKILPSDPNKFMASFGEVKSV